jgi:SAM-dependent methyltransferase
MAEGEPTFMNTIPSRRPYQGVIQILQFNWRFYLATAGSIGVALVALPFLPSLGRTVLLLGTAPALFWLASSLLVSHYVYDRFPLYDLNWVCSVLSRAPRRWISIHCGLDETSALLAAIFPDAASQVVDIFDPQVTTETSIGVARRATHHTIPSPSMQYDSLAFPAEWFDAAFSIFAAHELRHHDQRVRLFGEIARILTPGGKFILMEHSRDWRNFLAFGPGFLHFFSEKAWRKAASDAGMTVRTELSMTPFVHAYVLRRAI